MSVHPQPVDYSQAVAVSMNMAGRFTGREIRGFGQNVLKHILVQKKVSLFIGQQINFKPKLPDHYHFLGTNRAFMCYNSHMFKVCDERQYRHFLRDLHIRGQLPHHYLPDTNYVVMKMRFRQKPWTEFIAMSWFTDERQTKLKNLGHLRKVMHYVMHLAEAEEIPVLLGGTFRMDLDAIKMEMDGDFRCYGYIPSTPRRRMRQSNVFICAKPMKMHAVKPLVCAKLSFEKDNSPKLLNPEDAFYWDPVIGDLLFPIQTPESVEKARELEEEQRRLLEQQIEVTSVERPVVISRNMAGITSKHLLIQSPGARTTNILLPTAPVLPTPQSTQVHDKHAYQPPPPSPTESTPVPLCRSTPDDDPNFLAAIDEVSSEFEHQESFHSETGALAAEVEAALAEQEREQRMFDLLEAMMNDKSSSFFVNNGVAMEYDPEGEQCGLDPVILNLIQTNQLQSVEELKATIKSRIQAGDCPTTLLPESILKILNQDPDNVDAGNPETTMTSSKAIITRTSRTNVAAAEEGISHTELEKSIMNKIARIPS